MNRKKSKVPDRMFPSQRIPKVPEQLPKAKWVAHHDDPPCFERLVDDECPVCHFRPPSQWVAIMAYCPSCDCRLKDKKCPRCEKTFAYE